ncbi:alpha/beta hydrolase family protein [Streptomyces sp. NBC_00162]|uniref:alpha/beta hydrolase family protein n=1 Tax=Streptomyces sp. NBC_00162 TaxID=2903629 RepID=UPI00214A8FB4|nr:alpha/beta hydrolase family protein [Streptomyces sp. NBC_00162]UUU38458.1 alpha/beta hydrolase family protein [Streptomyces sp. NBC_00162]
MRRFGRTMVTAALAVAVVGGTAGWASGDSQRAVTGPPPGAAAWRADTASGRALPDPASATPHEVARFFDRLDEATRRELVRSHPLVVGNLDGAPPSLRYEANRIAIAATGEARYASLGAPDRQVLAFDPRGRGQVAEVFGDLEHAAHVSVIVPGSDNDATHHDARRKPASGPAGMARALRAETGESTAVIAWIGYTTPVGVGLDAADGRLAEAGAVRLARFTAGLDAVGAPDPVLFCHSYGSVVCGLAARHTDATDIVAFGSPGMRAGTAGGLRTGARVWAARGPSDWIADVPNVEFAGIGHGADPTSAGFGARRVPAADVQGHTGYFAPGTQSLAAFAAIAEGEIR